jgi:hypothetical protein
MRLAKYLMTVAAVTMAGAPAFAAPVNPASKLSVAPSVRASTSAKKSEKMAGGVVVAVLAAAAVVAGVVVVASDDNDKADSN